MKNNRRRRETNRYCVLLSPFLLIAQQNKGAWTNIGPSPAAVEAIAVDPHGSGTIFMGTIAGGVRKSVDGGITWSAVNSGLTTPLVLALAMDASGPQTVYAGTSGSLFKTGDGGVTWQNIPAISGAVVSVAAATADGSPALKVRGKLLACVPAHRSAEPGSLVVRVGFDDRARPARSRPGCLLRDRPLSRLQRRAGLPVSRHTRCPAGLARYGYKSS